MSEKHWTDGLAERIEAVVAKNGYEAEHVVLPGGGVVAVEPFASLSLDVAAPGPAERYTHALGCVNARAVGRQAPGMIRILIAVGHGDTAVLRIAVRQSTPWNHFLKPDGTTAELVDAGGQPPYQAVDFEAVGEPVVH